LRIVLISDTHGYESQLTSGGATLPAGDVLIHAGDFSSHGGGDGPLNAFDDWLAEQPHPIKLVVRGHHDPRELALNRSSAMYASDPMCLVVDGLTICVLPHTKGGFRGAVSPCDVLVTHLPPKGVVDMTDKGCRAGSRPLTEAVADAPRKPRVWLCGHVHEANGYDTVSFGGNDVAPTLVVNGANADSGIDRLAHGPTILDVSLPLEPIRRQPPWQAAAGRESGVARAVVATSSRVGAGAGMSAVYRSTLVDVDALDGSLDRFAP